MWTLALLQSIFENSRSVFMCSNEIDKESGLHYTIFQLVIVSMYRTKNVTTIDSETDRKIIECVPGKRDSVALFFFKSISWVKKRTENVVT